MEGDIGCLVGVLDDAGVPLAKMVQAVTTLVSEVFLSIPSTGVHFLGASISRHSFLGRLTV